MVVWLMYCGVIRSGPQEFLPEDRAWGSAFHRPISNSVLGAKLPAEKGAQLLDETQNPAELIEMWLNTKWQERRTQLASR